MKTNGQRHAMSTSPWKNRIVGTALVDPRTLVPHEKNWRRHPKHQAAALAGAIDEIGFLKSVTVSQRSGKVLDGHLRVEEALRQKQETIPVEYVDLTEEEELIALATIDPLAAMAQAEKETLESLLAAIEVDNEDLDKMLNNLATQNDIAIKEQLEAITEDEAPIDRAEELLGCPSRIRSNLRSGWACQMLLCLTT
jgi:hypothetical protein